MAPTTHTETWLEAMIPIARSFRFRLEHPQRSWEADPLQSTCSRILWRSSARFVPRFSASIRRIAGDGPIAGLPYWNVDMSIHKQVKIWETTSLEFSGVMTNILNHNVFANPTVSLASPASFGVINSQGNNPRQIEMGVRVNF